MIRNKNDVHKACAVIRCALSNDDVEKLLLSVGHSPQAIADAFAIGQGCDYLAEAFTSFDEAIKQQLRLKGNKP